MDVGVQDVIHDIFPFRGSTLEFGGKATLFLGKECMQVGRWVVVC